MPVGGAGADTVLGGAGRDVLIGGAGEDRLVASGGDLLIGARTLFDLDPTALGAIRDEWASARPYRVRVANLRGEDNPRFAERLNRNYFLQTAGPQPTVLDDGARDVLIGGVGLDWFFVNPDGGTADVVVGSTAGEVKSR